MGTCCLTLTLPPVNRDWRHRARVLHQSGEAHRRRRSYCGNRGNPHNQPRLQSKPSYHPSNLAGRAHFTGICHGVCPPLTNGVDGRRWCPSAGVGLTNDDQRVIPGLMTHLIDTWLLTWRILLRVKSYNCLAAAPENCTPSQLSIYVIHMLYDAKHGI